jgi:SNF2 family DNA or RNA helicase
LLLTRADKFSKCLIFSQWSDLLTVAESGLERNGISFLSLASGTAEKKEKVVSTFLSTPSCRVLLINVKSGGYGIFPMDVFLDADVISFFTMSCTFSGRV